MDNQENAKDIPNQQAENADTARFETMIDDSIEGKGGFFEDKLKDLSLDEVKAIRKLIQDRMDALWPRASREALAARKWQDKLRNKVGSVLKNIPALKHIKGSPNAADYDETSDVFKTKYLRLHNQLANLEECAFQVARRKGLYY